MVGVLFFISQIIHSFGLDLEDIFSTLTPVFQASNGVIGKRRGKCEYTGK